MGCALEVLPKLDEPALSMMVKEKCIEDNIKYLRSRFNVTTVSLSKQVYWLPGRLSLRDYVKHKLAPGGYLG